MAGDVLKELLVAILTKFDESSNKQALAAVDKAQADITDREKKGQSERAKNLTASLGAASKQVTAFTKTVIQAGEKVSLGLVTIAGAVEGAAVAGTVALARLSKEMSQAYYSGQKLGSAVKDMDAFRYASEQAGSSAAKAQAGLEELGHLRNTNPAAYVGLLQRLGVAARDAAGNLRAPAQAAMDLAPALAKLPRQMQLLYGNQLGMDDDQTLAMTRPAFLVQVAQYREMQRKIGFDPEKAAADGAKFQQIWTRMWTAVDLVSRKVQAAFFDQVGGSVDHLTDWLVKNSGRISDLAIKVGDYVLHLATSIVDLTANFDKLSPATQRFIEIMAGLAAAFLTLRAGPLGAIMALAGALAFLWDDYEKYKQGLPSIVDWAKWEPQIKAAIEGLTTLWTKFDDISNKITGQGGLQVVMEGFAVFIAGSWVSRILAAFNSVSGGWALLLARLAVTNPVGLTATALTAGAVSNAEMARRTGRAMTSGDPNVKFDPATGFVNDLDFGYEKGGQENGSNPKTGAIAWLKGLFGLGGGDPDARTVKADIATTAESVKKLADGVGGAGEGGAGGALGAARGVLGWAARAMGGGRGSGYAPSHFAGFGNGGWEKAGASKQEVADYIRQQAAKTGIDPEVALRVAQSEGLGTYTGDHGTSFGAFQLHYGGSGIPGMNSSGLGDAFTRETGLDARDPKTWKAQVDFALRKAREGGWGPWHGAAHVGIGNRQGLDYHGPVPATSAPKPQVPSVAPRHGRTVPTIFTDDPGGGLPWRTSDMRDPRFSPTAPPAPLGVSPASLYHSYDGSRTTTVSPTLNQNVTINGVQDPHAIGHHLKHHAKRGVQDTLRNMQGAST